MSKYMDDDAARAAAFASDDDEDYDDNYGGDNDDNFGGQEGIGEDEEGYTASPSGDYNDSPSQGGRNQNDINKHGDGEEEYEWSAYYDPSGRLYYYNANTGESAWDAPEKFNPPPPQADGQEGGHVDEEKEDGHDVGREDKEKDHDEELTMEDGTPREGNGTPMADSPTGATTPAQDEGTPTAREDEPLGETPNVDAAAEGEDVATSAWVAYKDDEGREYYYNAETGQTQWEKPEGVQVSSPPPEDSTPIATADAADEYQDQQTPREYDDDEAEKEGEVATTPSVSEKDKMEVDEKEEEKEEEEDPLELAEKALKEPDAILEPGCLGHVSELVTGLGGQKGGVKAMQALVSGYHGQTSICGLLALWLAELKATSSKPTSMMTTATTSTYSSSSLLMGKASSNPETQTLVAQSQRDPFTAASDTVRTIAENVIHRLAKERFSKTGGDNILNLSKSEVTFLEEMMDSNRWRRLLIDLSATHKDSALLMYCLQSISKRGHHREIARRMNQADYFSVYNGMLASELAVVGKVAVRGQPGTSGIDSSEGGMEGLLSDLRRTCTSTSYTYLYAMEVLNDLVKRARSKKIPEGPRAVGVQRAIRKWIRLKEELEDAMMRQQSSSSSGAGGASSSSGLNPLARKRRLDVALTMSDLHQRTRRRVDPTSATDNEIASCLKRNDNSNTRSIDSAILMLLKKFSLGMPFDEHIMDQLYRLVGIESAKHKEVGQLLIEHPLTIQALMGGLFKPGSARVRSPDSRRKCAKLVAMAVVAAGRAALETADKNSDIPSELNEDLDEDKIAEALQKGSRLCEQVEIMVSFTVTDVPKDDEESSSVGIRLSSLAIKSTPVAQGVVLWATELSSASDFAASAAYPTLSPSIMSLARIIAVHHPFTRKAVLDLALIFLKHSNPDFSYQKTQALKEQCLRLLLWLSTQGQAIMVFDIITKKLRQSSNSEIDAALLRYFVGGLLDLFRPPFSLPLIRSLGTMLATKRCVDALKSDYFENKSKGQLTGLVENFHKTVSRKRKYAPRASEEECALVSSLVSIYCSN